MLNRMLSVLGIGALGLLAVGCGQPLRTVTHLSVWKGPAGEYIYIGYAEDSDTSKLRRCAVNEDNTLACNEEEAANAVLNAKK
ncbi:MAG: hypothetical protein HY908_26060 [Myxococcales bacterium]|nr:hypothetical protein [Myxococcales bacterium]